MTSRVRCEGKDTNNRGDFGIRVNIIPMAAASLTMPASRLRERQSDVVELVFRNSAVPHIPEISLRSSRQYPLSGSRRIRIRAESSARQHFLPAHRCWSGIHSSQSRRQRLGCTSRCSGDHFLPGEGCDIVVPYGHSCQFVKSGYRWPFLSCGSCVLRVQISFRFSPVPYRRRDETPPVPVTAYSGKGTPAQYRSLGNTRWSPPSGDPHHSDGNLRTRP